MINLNLLARTITLREGKKQQISIAQVKEVMKIVFEELAKFKASDILKTIERYE